MYSSLANFLSISPNLTKRTFPREKLPCELREAKFTLALTLMHLVKRDFEKSKISTFKVEIFDFEILDPRENLQSENRLGDRDRYRSQFKEDHRPTLQIRASCESDAFP